VITGADLSARTFRGRLQAGNPDLARAVDKVSLRTLRA